jgi:sugar O-acyltransferase (sialic acid O-acetyltransferase NeuD family)
MWGGRSKARIIERMIYEQFTGDCEITGIFDPTLEKLPFPSSTKLITSPDALRKILGDLTHFVTCIGGEHGYARYTISEELKKLGLEPVDLISRSAILDGVDGIGEGLQMMPGAVVHKFSSLGNQCIVNTNSTIDHECILGDGVHVMGSASIAGLVTIGDFATIGTNATILPNLRVGKGAYVGAGAVVTKDVEDFSVVLGVPARVVKKKELFVDMSFFQE